MRETDRVYDELLVTLVRSGDRRAAERLAARWQPRLFRTARRLLAHEDQARDVVQETWAALFKGLLRLSDPARFPAWAFGILHRKVADRLRQESRRRSADAALRDLPPADPEGGGEDALAVRQALAALGRDQRLAAILFFAEGLTVAEIAEATGVPAGTVKSRLFHARRRLKAALTGDQDDRN